MNKYKPLVDNSSKIITFFKKKISIQKQKTFIIITANPFLKNSKGFFCLKEAFNRIDSNQIAFDILNLYDYDIPFRATHTKADQNITKIFNIINKYNNWIFVYPIWWSNTPAILKNFIDWLGFFSLTYINGKPKGLLKNKKIIIIAACSNNEKKYTKKQKQYIKQQLGKEFFEFCGAKLIKCFLISGTSSITSQRLNDYIKSIQTTIIASDKA